MTPANEPAGDSVAQPEPLISSYLQREAGSVPPDAGSLVLRAVAQGQRVRRRRLAFGAAGVAASVAVAAIAVTGLAAPGWMHRAVEPASTQSLVPATPRGLAAAIMAHLPGDRPASVGGATIRGAHAGMLAGSIGVELQYELAGHQTELFVMAVPNSGIWRTIGSCRTGSVPTPNLCTLSTLAGGDRMLSFDTTDGGWTAYSSHPPAKIQAGYAVAVDRHGQVILVSEQLSVAPRQAAAMRRTQSYPIAVSILKAIATDPLVGMQTSPQTIAAGAKIADFGHQLAEFTSGSGPRSAYYSSGGGCAPPPGQSSSTICSSGSASGSANSPCSSKTQSGCSAESPTPSLSGSGTASYGSGCNTATGASCRPRDYATPRPSPPAK